MRSNGEKHDCDIPLETMEILIKLFRCPLCSYRNWIVAESDWEEDDS